MSTSDPFGPDQEHPEKRIFCLHCNGTFLMRQMVLRITFRRPGFVALSESTLWRRRVRLRPLYRALVVRESKRSHKGEQALRKRYVCVSAIMDSRGMENHHACIILAILHQSYFCSGRHTMGANSSC